MTKYEFLVAEIERLRENPTDKCVEWPFSRRTANGYGQLSHYYKTYSVHRLAFEILHGHKSVNCVCHHCDNPACYNPHHLYDGTQAQNSADAVRRGQIQCALSDSQLCIARRLLGSGYSRPMIAAMFGVSRGTAWKYTSEMPWLQFGPLSYPLKTKRHNGGNNHLFTTDYSQECTIVDLYNSGKTYQEIGDHFDVSRQRIHQVLRRVYRESQQPK